LPASRDFASISQRAAKAGRSVLGIRAVLGLGFAVCGRAKAGRSVLGIRAVLGLGFAVCGRVTVGESVLSVFGVVGHIRTCWNVLRI